MPNGSRWGGRGEARGHVIAAMELSVHSERAEKMDV
jgi:hypothetical protein